MYSVSYMYYQRSFKTLASPIISTNTFNNIRMYMQNHGKVCNFLKKSSRIHVHVYYVLKGNESTRSCVE